MTLPTYTVSFAILLCSLAACVGPNTTESLTPAFSTRASDSATSKSGVEADANTPLAQVVKNHPRVAAARADFESATRRVSVASGDYYPTLNLSSEAGRERLDKVGTGADTSLLYNQTTLKISQLLSDFGRTKSKVLESEITAARNEVQFFQTQQQVWLDVLTAIIELRRARALYDVAIKSEASVREQTQLEEARLEAGGGASRDVLQLKTQLAGAKARRIAAWGDVLNAETGFHTLFGFAPPDNLSRYPTRFRTGTIPRSADQAVAAAMEKNPSVLGAELDAKLAVQSAISAKKQEYSPVLEAVGEQRYKNNSGGVAGHQKETVVKLMLNIPVNLGPKSIASVEAAEKDAEAAKLRFEDARNATETSVRLAWQALVTARLTAESREEQASLALEFFELAKQGNELGTTGQLEVLSSETGYSSAQADAFSSRIDVKLAEIRLVEALGIPLGQSMTKLN
jgi:adhesin transport system outer membrane protein